MENNPFPSLSQLLSAKQQAVVPPSGVAEYLRNLSIPLGTTPQSLLSAAPSIERSTIDKISDATRRVRKLLTEGKINRTSQREWIQRLIICLRPFYGRKSSLLATLGQWQKEIGKAQIATEDFATRVEQVEHYLRALNDPANRGSFVVASQRSLVPTSSL